MKRKRKSDDEWIADAVRHDVFAGLPREKVSLVILPMNVPPVKPGKRDLPALVGKPNRIAMAEKIRRAFLDREGSLQSEVDEKSPKTELMHDCITTIFDNARKNSSSNWWIKNKKHLKIELKNELLFGQIIVIAERYGMNPFRR